MDRRKFGHSDIDVNPLGMGCWAVGGPFWRADGGPSWNVSTDDLSPGGWGQVDDAQSIRAIQTAIDLGVNVFDTSSSYGAGHSERVLGQAIARQRDKVVIVTKFANIIDEERKLYLGHDASPAAVRQSCEDSLQRLNTDYLDVFLLHWHNFDGDMTELLDTLESLVAAGKIRYYGWSTDLVDKAREMAAGNHCLAMEHHISAMHDVPDMLALCDEFDLVSLVRSPLTMGILTGKFTADSTFGKDDIRRGWNFKDGRQAFLQEIVESLREVLTSDGRSMVQGALAWIWARSTRTIPVPGFKNVAQVEENCRALEFGPLSDDQMRQVAEIMAQYED